MTSPCRRLHVVSPEDAFTGPKMFQVLTLGFRPRCSSDGVSVRQGISPCRKYQWFCSENYFHWWECQSKCGQNTLAPCLIVAGSGAACWRAPLFGNGAETDTYFRCVCKVLSFLLFQIIVGSSMGAWLMILVTIERPHRVHSLIGVSSAPDFTQRAFARFSPEVRNMFWFLLYCWQPSELAKGIFGQILKKQNKTKNTKKKKKTNQTNCLLQVLQVLQDTGGTVVESEYGNYIITKNFLNDTKKYNILHLKSIPVLCPVRLIHGMKVINWHFQCLKSTVWFKKVSSLSFMRKANDPSYPLSTYHCYAPNHPHRLSRLSLLFPVLISSGQLRATQHFRKTCWENFQQRRASDTQENWRPQTVKESWHSIALRRAGRSYSWHKRRSDWVGRIKSFCIFFAHEIAGENSRI